jgi:RNA polymerase sigma factor (sigma-70 family)
MTVAVEQFPGGNDDRRVLEERWSGRSRRFLRRRLNPQIFRRFCPIPKLCSPTAFELEQVMTTEISSLVESAACLESRGEAARSAGDELSAEGYFREALGLAVKAANGAAEDSSKKTSLEALQMAVRLGLNCGEVFEARKLLEEALRASPSITTSDEWDRFRDASAWPDSWLIAAVRRDPPDEAALDALADRHWKTLFGRCYLMTLDREKANDLAQHAWARILRARQRLLPGGNFPAYLTTAATNIWRDAHRSTQRAGPLAYKKLASLDESLSTNDEDSIVLSDILPDLRSLETEQQTLLKVDLDRALEQLTPHVRDILLSRFITGESSAEIAVRFKRTEQTVSGWVREGIRQMKLYLEQPAPATALTKEP